MGRLGEGVEKRILADVRKSRIVVDHMGIPGLMKAMPMGMGDGVKSSRPLKNK